MSGLFRRKSSRRSEGPESTQAEPGPADAPANAPAEPGGHESLLVDPAAQTRVLREGETVAEPAPAAEGEATPPDPATTVHPVVRLQAPQPAQPVAAPEPPMVPVSDLPAGVDPDELAAAPPTSARRSRLRRRVSYLRAAREVLLRDLGGFVYELHRTAGDIEHEAHRRLREIKLARLTRLDTELHELELRLDDVRRHVVVREPGVGGECPNCGELFGSDAHYCAHCGLPLTESARRAVAREHPPEPEPVAAPEPVPAPDQPTQEFSALATSEFHWPDRTQADEAAPGEPAAEREDAAGDEPAAEREDAAGDEPAVARDDDAAEDEPAVARGDDAAPGEPAVGREEDAEGEPAVARDDDAAPGDTRGDEPAADDAAGEPGPGAWHDSPGNGRDDAYRPVERRG
jgi:hypothetical protein